MVIDLLGVLESGGKPDPGVPTDVRRPVAFAAGQSVTFRLHAIERSGVPIVLGVGDSIALTARQSTTRPSRRYFDVAFTAIDGRPPGWYSAATTPAQSRGLDGLTGVFDVWLRRAGGAQDVLIPTSELRFNPAAADPPAAS